MVVVSSMPAMSIVGYLVIIFSLGGVGVGALFLLACRGNFQSFSIFTASTFYGLKSSVLCLWIVASAMSMQVVMYLLSVLTWSSIHGGGVVVVLYFVSSLFAAGRCCVPVVCG
jgi:hypothetical protein